MIPNNLNEWSFPLIEKLIQEGIFETDRLDFKEDIPHVNNNSGKEKLENSVCAFANTEGGFLIFGIKDDRAQEAHDRIIGIEPQKDFPREFGDKTVNIQPHVYYDFLNPPIKIPNKDSVIHIIKIPQSPERPHLTGRKEFYYRTNKGNMQMDYQQIKDSFLNEEQRRQKLRLLFIELVSNKEQAGSMIIEGDGNYSLITLDSQVLQTLLVDTYQTITKEEELIRLLITIREKIMIINNKTGIFYSQMSLPLLSKTDIVNEHNKFIKKVATGLIELIERALKILSDKFGLTDPFK